jgi:hypothetical protein
MAFQLNSTPSSNYVTLQFGLSLALFALPGCICIPWAGPPQLTGETRLFISLQAIIAFTHFHLVWRSIRRSRSGGSETTFIRMPLLGWWKHSDGLQQHPPVASVVLGLMAMALTL